MPIAGNPEVLPVERHHTMNRLKAFLIEYLGNAPDAAVKANEMALKFEDHVFKSTSTKDEYVQTIQARMKFVQLKKTQQHLQHQQQQQPSPSVLVDHQQPIVQQKPEESNFELNEMERNAFYTKIEQFRNLIPRMEKLIEMHSRLGTNAEMIRKYAGFKNVIQRQLELLPSNTFIMPINVINNIFEQSTKMTVFLATKAKEILASNPEPSSTGLSTPVKLKQAQPAVRKPRRTSEESVVSVKAPFSDIEPNFQLIEYELATLSQEMTQLTNFSVTSSPPSVTFDLKGNKFTLMIPADYPSMSQLQIVSDISKNLPAIIAPVTITTTIRLLYLSLCK